MLEGSIEPLEPPLATGLGPRAVSNSGDPTANVKHRNSFGSAQEYQVSIYVSKMNL